MLLVMSLLEFEVSFPCLAELGSLPLGVCLIDSHSWTCYSFLISPRNSYVIVSNWIFEKSGLINLSTLSQPLFTSFNYYSNLNFSLKFYDIGIIMVLWLNDFISLTFSYFLLTDCSLFFLKVCLCNLIHTIDAWFGTISSIYIPYCE